MTTDTLEKPTALSSELDTSPQTLDLPKHTPPRSKVPDKVIDMAPGQNIRFRSQANGELHIENPDGEVEFTIVWENGRAQISMRRADLRIDTVGDLDIQCQNFRVASQENLELQAGQECSIQSNEHLRLRSKAVEATATLGDILLQANDFVRALGEKILLNTDRDPEESQKRAKSFLNKLIGY